MKLDTANAAARARKPATAGGSSSLGRKATLLCISALTIMSGATIAPSLPALEAHFAGSGGDVALLTRFVLTVPALMIAIFAPLAGGLIDRFGRRRLLLGSILLYGFAGMSGLLLDTLHGLLLGRALLGMAVAGSMTTATALVGDYFAGIERDRFMGLQAAFVGFGGLVFLTSGGLLAEQHWRAPFAVYGIAFALLPAVLRWLTEPRRIAPAAGALLPGPGVALAVPLQRGALVAIFAAGLLNSVTFYLLPTQLPFHLQALGSGAPTLSGLAIGLFNLASAALSLSYGRARRGSSVAGLFAIGFAIMAAGHALVALATSYAAVVVAVTVVGAGMGLVIPNLFAAAMSLAPSAARGRVAGGLTASIFLGQFASPLISQPWIASFGMAATFRDAALLVAATAAVAAAAAALGALRRRPRG